MTATLQFTAKDTGAALAGDITAATVNIGLGVPAAMSTTFSMGFINPTATVFGGDTSTNVTAYSGYRRTKVADLSDRPYVQCQLGFNTMGRNTLAKYAAGGGIILVFVDNVGNFAAYKVFGGDDNFGPFSTAANGYLAGFTSPQTEFAHIINIERARTPDYASATPIDWANIAAYEVHFRPTSATRCQLVVAMLRTVDVPVSTGAVSALMAGIIAAWTTLAPGTTMFYLKATPPWSGGTAGTVYATQLGLQVGDGATATTGTVANAALAFWTPPEDAHDTASPVYPGPGCCVMPSTPRLLDVFQSASDNVTFNDIGLAGSRLWGLKVRGTPGVCAFNRNVFTRPAQFECAHGVFTDCIWDGHTAAILCTALTQIVRGIVRNGVGHGVKITGPAGNYAALAVAFSGNSTYDVELGSGGAGTYSLSAISCTGTLKIRNDSASNAIVVAIPAGIAFTTSTAGGAISVTTPPTYQSVAISGMVAGSRLQIFDTTNAVELYNGVPGGTTYTWTDSVAAAAARAIRVRIAYVSGATARQFLEAAIGSCGTGTTDAALSYLATQVADAVYNTNAIDGSAVTGITISDAIDRVLISAAGGAKTYPQIYAYQCWWLSTAAGIIDDGAFITAVDTANYLFTGFQIRNTSATPLTISGGYGRDATTGTSAALIDTAGSTGNIFLAPDHVVPFSTGSGLTAGQSAQLTSIASATGNLTFTGSAVNVNVAQLAARPLTGSGTSADPFRPA